jgi:hypothetical protein
MTGGAGSAGEVQRRSALLAVALSDRRRMDACLVTGEHRAFGLDADRRIVRVPHPHLGPAWSTRTVTLGIALQCSPSKDRIAPFKLDDLTARERLAVSVTEFQVALGWLGVRWPGLLPEAQRMVGGLEAADPDMDGGDILDAGISLARTRERLRPHPLFGRLPITAAHRDGLQASARRMFGRLPWSSRRTQPPRVLYSIPVGGDGGVRDPNLAPPSRPEDEEIEIRPDERVGIPYPEWNMWTKRFLADHVAVLERRSGTRAQKPVPASPEVRRWFEEHTHRVLRNGLEDGSDLDIGRYVDHYIDQVSGSTSDARLFRDLVPGHRDVTTAVLLDGSSSLGVQQGHIFALELTCADWLSQAMTVARERHGIFTFTGNTRHRVEVNCLKDFHEPRSVRPSRLGLRTGGYTRLGAPIRHLTSRLLAQPSARRLLILIGDGLMCDEGYEGRYAWADVEHAVEEADEAGVALYYIGVGSTRVDPLPEVFGPLRSQRIRCVEELPRVLAHVHRQLVAA